MVGDGARGHSHTLNTRRADQKDDDDGFSKHKILKIMSFCSKCI